MMEDTTDCHHQIADARLPQADPVFDDTTCCGHARCAAGGGAAPDGLSAVPGSARRSGVCGDAGQMVIALTEEGRDKIDGGDGLVLVWHGFRTPYQRGGTARP